MDSYELFRPFDEDIDHAGLDLALSAPTRGVTCVLGWATAGVVLVLVIVTLADFAYCLAAELRLAKAARAAALEATLPHASYDTVCRVAKGRLAHDAPLASAVRVWLLQSGVPVRRAFQPKPSDRIAVTLTVPKSAVEPYWLQVLSFSRADQPITVRAERDLADKELPASMARGLMFAR